MGLGGAGEGLGRGWGGGRGGVQIDRIGHAKVAEVRGGEAESSHFRSLSTAICNGCKFSWQSFAGADTFHSFYIYRVTEYADTSVIQYNSQSWALTTTAATTRQCFQAMNWLLVALLLLTLWQLRFDTKRLNKTLVV